jgi:hypothetical protein
MLWQWINTPHWVWWALYATTFATGALVHVARINALRWRAPTHMWLEVIGMSLWSAGGVIGGIGAGMHPAANATSPTIRTLWVLGSLCLLCAGFSFMFRQWRLK